MAWKFGRGSWCYVSHVLNTLHLINTNKLFSHVWGFGYYEQKLDDQTELYRDLIEAEKERNKQEVEQLKARPPEHEGSEVSKELQKENEDLRRQLSQCRACQRICTPEEH